MQFFRVSKSYHLSNQGLWIFPSVFWNFFFLTVCWNLFFDHLSLVTYHSSFITHHLSLITYHSFITHHLSLITYHSSFFSCSRSAILDIFPINSAGILPEFFGGNFFIPRCIALLVGTIARCVPLRRGFPQGSRRKNFAG